MSQPETPQPQDNDRRLGLKITFRSITYWLRILSKVLLVLTFGMLTCCCCVAYELKKEDWAYKTFIDFTNNNTTTTIKKVRFEGEARDVDFTSPEEIQFFTTLLRSRTGYYANPVNGVSARIYFSNGLTQPVDFKLDKTGKIIAVGYSGSFDDYWVYHLKSSDTTPDSIQAFIDGRLQLKR